jgi:hypothetical protein
MADISPVHEIFVNITSGKQVYIYSAVLKRLTTPSDFQIPLPSIVPFARS